jgi:starch-binding outer membrane protein, SusD/RagB family
MTTMKSPMKYLIVSGVVVATACSPDLNVPNYNAQSIDALQDAPTPAAISTAAVGVLGASRDFNTSFLQSWVVSSGEFGREGMELDPSNPQHPIDRLQQIGGSEPSYAGYPTAYRVIKQANVLIHALDKVAGLTDAQKNATRGFALTMQAVAFQRLYISFYLSGVPIDVDIAPTDPIAPVATADQVLTRISKLLDDGKTALLAGGAAFPFTMPSGMSSVATPANFLKFNRALRARNAVYQKDWNAALTAVGESFISSTASLKLGAYDTYSTTSGDKSNPLYDPTCRQLFTMPDLKSKAQTQANGSVDQRYLDKVQDFTPKVSDGITVNGCFLPLYPTASTPVPIIRNEEMFLIRAEANMQLGNRVAALSDINFIRTTSGKLSAITDPGDPGLLNELLYNRWFSLIWEGGHRLADMRRYNKLSELPKVLSNHKIFPYLPLGLDECVPRSATAAPPGCTAAAGI